MAIIHRQPLNFILRSVFHPFRKLIPEKYYFAIDGDISVPLTEGKTMKFTGNPTSNLVRLLFWYGYKGFEPAEYDIFVEVARKSTCLMDVGANLGYYSIVGKLFNNNLTVHAFEPMPDARLYLKKNLDLNNFSEVVVSPLALSDKRGQASFYSNRNPRFPHIKEHLFGDNSLDENFPNKAYEQIEIKVETDTLDNYVKSQLKAGQKVDFLKMDTEGSEHMVLAGSSVVLSEHQPVIMCEVVRHCIEDKLEAIFASHGYSFYRIQNNKLVNVADLRAHEQKEDYFFLRPQHLSRLSKYL